jgi:glc operon protein GlcG
MSHRQFAVYLLGISLCLGSVAAQAPKAADPTASPMGQMHIPYGISVGIDDAKKMAAAAVAVAQKEKWTVAIAVTDVAGDLVYFEKMDGTEVAAVDMAMGKARSAVRFRRPTKDFQDTLATGGANLRVLGMIGAVPVGGGIPLVKDGKMIGALGISGGSTQDDERVATAAVAALK